MSDLQVIENTLCRMVARRRLHRAWRLFWQCLFVASSGWLLALAAFKLLPIPESALSWAGVMALASLPLGFLAGWWRRPGLGETARWVDGQEHFQERLGTALEVARSQNSGAWKHLVMADAAGCARKLDLRAALPFRLPEITRWSLVVLILAATLGFVPEFRSKEFLQKQREAEVMRDAGQRLVEFSRRNLDQRPALAEPARKSLETLQEMGLDLAKVKLNRDDALKGLSSAADKLAEQLKEIGRDPTFRKLEQAARTSAAQSAAGNPDLQKQMDGMQKAGSDPKNVQDALEQVRRDLDKLQQAAAGFPQNDQTAADAKRQELSQSLSQLAKKAQDLGLDLPSLDEAIKALESSEIDKFLKDLDSAEVNLEKLQTMAKAMDQLQKKMAALGKNLSEQLDKGQAQAAAQTLRKMAEQMKNSGLSKEQMEKILNEVKEALGPAKEYGKVSDLLSAACKKGGQGDPAGSSQDLASAAAELEKMMEEMQDGEAMLAALEALQKAQMCIGNCEGWCQCKGPPKAGKGGKPGRGVGTWADENGWMDVPEITERWDNTGIERPDTDPRGHTDRGDGALADNLVQTRLKGRISPGGSMPSMTLKGLSIKGTSKLSYQETGSAAQGDGQSALSQEHVPRAYQGAVRDYFDDSKNK
jgi:hypothetical protein